MNIPGKYCRFERDGSERADADSPTSRFAPPGGLLTFLGGRPRYIPIFGGAMVALAAVFLSVARERPVLPSRQADPKGVAIENLQTLRNALEVFRHDCGRYPTTGETLRVLVDDHGIVGWRGPYIYNLTRDPWRTPFFYAVPTGGVSLSSSGPDRVFGTADDILAPPVDTGLVVLLIEERKRSDASSPAVIPVRVAPVPASP
jgi:general secretion pathway protein G